MTEDPKHLVRTQHLRAEDAIRIRHPLNPSSEVFVHPLSDQVGMARAHLSLARLPPGKESFIVHSHSLQEEFLFILDGNGLATIGEQQVPVGAGDYLAFPTDGTPHHLANIGKCDLVYLMGGERTAVEIGYFPTLGKIAVFRAGSFSCSIKPQRKSFLCAPGSPVKTSTPEEVTPDAPAKRGCFSSGHLIVPATRLTCC